WLNQRLVTLNINHDLSPEIMSHLGDSVGAAQMIRPRYRRIKPRLVRRFKNPGIICGDNRSENSLSSGGSFRDPHNQGFSRNRETRLTRQKHAIVASWDYCNGFLLGIFTRVNHGITR